MFAIKFTPSAIFSPKLFAFWFWKLDQRGNYGLFSFCSCQKIPAFSQRRCCRAVEIKFSYFSRLLERKCENLCDWKIKSVGGAKIQVVETADYKLFGEYNFSGRKVCRRDVCCSSGEKPSTRKDKSGKKKIEATKRIPSKYCTILVSVHQTWFEKKKSAEERHSRKYSCIKCNYYFNYCYEEVRSVMPSW